MTAKEFIAWLNETLLFVGAAKELNEAQTKILKDKLGQVFNKLTPNRNYLNFAGGTFQQAMTGPTLSGSGFSLTPQNLIYITC
jgi:hypothetical protein